jgi:hypothetical protein
MPAGPLLAHHRRLDRLGHRHVRRALLVRDRHDRDLLLELRLD